MAEAFDAVDVIVTKRDGGELADAQIDWVVDASRRSRCPRWRWPCCSTA
jgi:thymidine phosphorylase